MGIRLSISAFAALVAVVAVGATAACSKASPEGEKKKWQESPPPKDVTVPAGLTITVQVEGVARSPITTDLLDHTKPDFADAEHRAWKIQTLIPEAAPDGSVVEAASVSGVSVKLVRPMPEGLEPALLLNRRGEVIVAAVDPKDPFPSYHGQGSRLRRPGDSMPRVGQVAKLSITHAAIAPTP
jgi:hypothetical protein